MTPRGGNYTCDGPQITGTMCTFECNLGYNLAGPITRECLPNNEWSGNVSTCKILSCSELTGSDNSSVDLPCNKRLRSRCRISCSPGFYTTSDNPFQQCIVRSDNVAVWSEPPQCIGKYIHNVVCIIEYMYVCTYVKSGKNTR